MIAAALLLSISITSVTPSSGPVTGGTAVIIRGSGFAPCPPSPQVCGYVTFGYFNALSFRIIDSQTIEAVTPLAFPGPVTVNVVLTGGSTFMPNGFTYTGEISDAFETILLPVFMPAVSGSFGSQFLTFFSIWNTAPPDIPVFSFAPLPCQLSACVTPEGLFPLVMKARASAPMSAFQFDGDPGRLIYIPKGAFDRIAASLRVADVSRSLQTFGTRLPIVPEREFRSDFLALIDVPTSASFRNTLRVYSLDPETSVHIRVISSDSTRIGSEMDIDLRDPIDMFHPGYAQVSDLVTFFGGRIELEPRAPGKRIWAFASVTNNDTQQITVIAPH